MSGVNAFACGGMTQIDPPSLQLNTGPAAEDVNNLEGTTEVHRYHLKRPIGWPNTR